MSCEVLGSALDEGVHATDDAKYVIQLGQIQSAVEVKHFVSHHVDQAVKSQSLGNRNCLKRDKKVGIRKITAIIIDKANYFRRAVGESLRPQIQTLVWDPSSQALKSTSGTASTEDQFWLATWHSRRRSLPVPRLLR